MQKATIYQMIKAIAILFVQGVVFIGVYSLYSFLLVFEPYSYNPFPFVSALSIMYVIVAPLAISHFSK